MKLIISLLLMPILIGCNKQTETANTETQSTEEVAASQVEATEKSNDIVDLASLNSAQVGIESIERDGDKVAIHVYAINPQPMAGVQLQLQPRDVFEIDSVTGGRCEAMDFMMRSNPKGLVLGFSMQAKMIPVAENGSKKDNILFTAIGRVVKEVSQEIITLDAVLAGRGGAKLETQSLPYVWKGK